MSCAQPNPYSRKVSITLMTNLQRWHQCLFENDMKTVGELLADDVEFHSPTIWQPKQGKPVTQFILETIFIIFENFEYHREWIDGNDMALEFSATVEGKNLKGIDLITWNDQGKIIRIEVMLRPINALQLVFEKMTTQLVKAGLVKQ